MKLEAKHYAAIAAVIVIIIIILLTTFPLENPEYTGDEDITSQIPDYVPDQNEFSVGTDTYIDTPVQFTKEITDCLGTIQDNAFVPDSRSVPDTELNQPKITEGQNSVKIELYEKKYCFASTLDLNAFINWDGYLVVLELEDINIDKFVLGPTTADPDNRFDCLCTYKWTANITGLESGEQVLIIENKDFQDWRRLINVK